jgi:pSer/pThr/pTyr-binding forkhead associated (FHA) protein
MTDPRATAAALILRAADGTEYPVRQSTTIGRDADCGVAIVDTGISRRHAQLTLTAANTVLIEDLQSTNGTFVNGERLTAPRELAPGDEVRLHKTALTLSVAQPRIAAADATYMLRPGELPPLRESQPAPLQQTAGRGPCLVALSAPNRGRVFPLPPSGPISEWSIGRDASAAVRLVDRAVSKQHARIRQQGSRWRIEHVGATNQLFVNGAAVETVELQPGDRIRLGRTELQFQLEYRGELPSAQAVPQHRLVYALAAIVVAAAIALALAFLR